MLKNYLTIALRTLRRRRGYAALNVAGLALGLAGCLLIGLFVRHELAYDRHHEDADRVYRVVQHTNAEQTEGTAWVGGAMGNALRADFLQIEALARLVRSDVLVEVGEDEAKRTFERDRLVYADPSVFDVLTFPLVAGSADALGTPDQVFLTQTAARRYFGQADPVGETVTTGGRTLTVAGVLEDPPATTHLAFDLMTSLDTFKLAYWGTTDGEFQSYWWPRAHTYVKLREGASAAAIDAEMPAFIARHRDPAEAEQYVPALQPLADIHLRSSLGGEWQPGGSAATVAVFALVALFVLLLACVNFMNLATARATERAREVGVRKTLGARREQLVWQFFGESLLLSGIALAVAVAVAVLLLPFFADLAGRDLAFRLGDGALWAWVLGVTLVTGLLAGSYPALYLSRFRPARVLAGGKSGGRGAARLRQGLVLFQFTLSVALVAATAIAWQQLQYLQQADLGFDEDHVVVIQRKGADLDVLTERLRQEPSVVAVTTAERAPGFGFGDSPGVERPPYTPIERLDDNAGRTRHQSVGTGYFELFGVDLVAGRMLTDAPADIGTAVEREENFGNSAFDGRAFVVNEAFAEAQGWRPEEALGQELRMFYYENGNTYMDHRGRVVGVVEDFHAASFQYEITPSIFSPDRFPDAEGGSGLSAARYAFAKVRPGDAAATMAALGEAFAAVQPERAFEAAFLDDNLDARYRSEQRTGTILGAFAVFGLVIACLGLFGLATYAAERRTKEVGIRKTLGASVPGLVALLSRDFLALVALASVLAAPLAYVAMQRWLDGFAYRIEPGPVLFLAVAAGALAVALLTVAGQAFRAASADPVQSLRHE
ncbi:MAG: ABC transporter permease [Bacteroidota bacterium]